VPALQVVVTGAGGFSGSHLVANLLARGHRVTAIVGRNRDRLDALARPQAQLTVVHGDLARPLPLPAHIDAIVHAAARSPAPGVSASTMVRDNVVATEQLLDYATTAGARTFIYLSTLSVYGTISAPVVDETTAIINPDTYGTTKYLGEMMLGELPLRSMSIRLPGVLGPNSVRNWLTGVLADARADRTIACYNPHSPFNNAIHISDLCDFIADLVKDGGWSGHHVVTVGAKGHTRVQRAVQIIIDTLGSRSSIRISDVARPSFTISSATAERFGYRPMAVEAMLAQFARENADST
jgi:nucleoside-diphosphate-sugar epimerase